MGQTFIINDITIPETTGAVIVSGTSVDKMYENDDLVWAKGDSTIAAPTNCSATDGTSVDTVTITWGASITPGATYNLYRDGVVKQSGLTGLSHIDTTVDPGTIYEYYIVACVVTDCSGPSNIDPGYAGTAVKPASNLVASDGTSETTVFVTWTASPDSGVEYRLYRGGVALLTLAGTSYDDTTVIPNTTYSYYVVACDSVPNCSVQSNTDTGYAEVEVDVEPPSSVRATDGLFAEYVSIDWDHSSDGVPDNYIVSVDDVDVVTLSGDILNYLFSTDTNTGEILSFGVRAVVDGVESPADYDPGSSVPAQPPNFSATDGTIVNSVKLTWTIVEGDTVQYTIYANDIEIGLSGIGASSYSVNVSATIPVSYAVSGVGSSGNNGAKSIADYGYPDSGIPLTGDVTIDFDAVTGGDSDTVTGSNGEYTFTAPYDLVLNFCITGGGGAGGSNDYLGTFASSGGGHAGRTITGSINILEGRTMPISIGLGGSGVFAADGLPGAATVFDGVVAIGGLGGDEASFNYGGHGGPQAGCDGTTYYDGTQSYNPNNHQAGGGEASEAGNGGDGGVAESPPSQGEAGGGGGSTARSLGITGGKGGNGRVSLSWG